MWWLTALAILAGSLYAVLRMTTMDTVQVPGQKAAPIFGHALGFFGDGMLTSFQKFGQLYGPIFKVRLGMKPVVVVSDPDLGRAVAFKNMQRPVLKAANLKEEADRFDATSFLFSRGHQWQRLRAAWQPAFTTESLKGYLPLMARGVNRFREVLANKARTGEVVDIKTELANMTLEVIGTTAFGVSFHTLDPEDSPSSAEGRELAKVTAAAFRLSGILGTRSPYMMVTALFPGLWPILRPLARWFPDKDVLELSETKSKLMAVGRSLVEDWQRSHPRTSQLAPCGPEVPSSKVQCGSFLDHLLQMRNKANGEKLSDDEILGQAVVFILAGYETTALVLAYTVYLLALNPEAEKKLQEEVDTAHFGQANETITMEDLDKLSYVDACFKEAMRLYPPGFVLIRELAASTSLGGYSLPAGQAVYVDAYNMHRNPNIWPRADEYLPERHLESHPELHPKTPHAFIPFGGGSRMCTGFRFATLEAKISLLMLYRQFTFELKEGQIPLAVETGVNLRPKEGVWVKVKTRSG